MSKPQIMDHIRDTLLRSIDDRAKDIIRRRFGLNSEKIETLDSIGKQYGITRERVRQIEAHAIQALANFAEIHEPVTVIFLKIFGDNGGILTDRYLINLIEKETGAPVLRNTILFYLHILRDFEHTPEDPVFHEHWRTPSGIYEHPDDVINSSAELLKETGHPLVERELYRLVTIALGRTQISIAEHIFHALLIAAKNIKQTAFGEYGLVQWEEVSPRGVGDKAFAVLRRKRNPIHFREITELINNAKFDQKIANPQTVHNELIRDGRFILVGRGLYGLNEWGYMPGTVADVLEAVLKKAGKPLTRDELITEVLKQRIVKKNTIALSLQNEKRFSKTTENLYELHNR